MQGFILIIFCCIFYEVNAQVTNTLSTFTFVPQTQTNWEEFTTTHQTVNDNAKAKKDKFTCVLNLLKNALSEELENSQCYITEETIQDSALSSLNSILEEEQMKKENGEGIDKQGLIDQNRTDSEKALYQKIISKIASAFSKQPNVTNNHSNMDIPSMIPIFKPRQTIPKHDMIQNIADNNVPKQIPKSKAVSFVPEKIIQTNFSPVSSASQFVIPCQRASDVLDMTNVAIPNDAIQKKNNVKTNTGSIDEATKLNLPTQIPAPVTLSVNCADSEDTVAMLFKPKNISLMQLYGNLLKKITITVLVPYHMSKLGQS